MFRVMLIALCAVAVTDARARSPSLLSGVATLKVGDVNVGAALPNKSCFLQWSAFSNLGKGPKKQRTLTTVLAVADYPGFNPVDVETTVESAQLGKLVVDGEVNLDGQIRVKALSLEKHIMVLGKKLFLTPMYKLRNEALSLRTKCAIAAGVVVEGTWLPDGKIKDPKMTLDVSSEDQLCVTPGRVQWKHALSDADLLVALSEPRDPCAAVEYKGRDAHGGWSVSVASPLQEVLSPTLKINRDVNLDPLLRGGTGLSV